jgi:hypothetical protein
MVQMDRSSATVKVPGAFLFNTNVMRKKSPQLPKIYHDRAVISTRHQEVASCSFNRFMGIGWQVDETEGARSHFVWCGIWEHASGGVVFEKNSVIESFTPKSQRKLLAEEHRSCASEKRMVHAFGDTVESGVYGGVISCEMRIESKYK